MTGTDDPYAWLDARATRIASDIALGCVLLIAGAAAILNGPALSFADPENLGAGFFPTVVAGLLVAVGIVLLVRGSVFGGGRPARWSLKGLAIIVATIVVVCVAAAMWGVHVMLLFGPAEYAALLLALLVVAIAIACRSRVQAFGMALLGLLLSAVGLDLETGVPRLTMHLEQLLDGITGPIVWLGLFVVGDGLVCLASPSLWLATYARIVNGWVAPRIPALIEIGIRIVAALAIAGACYLAFEFEQRIWDIGALALFGAFGVAGKLLAWNRLVLLMAFVWGGLLEESIRRSMLISRGDPTVFVARPISGTLVVLATCILALAALMSARRRLSRPSQQPS